VFLLAHGMLDAAHMQLSLTVVVRFVEPDGIGPRSATPANRQGAEGA
jgi:hypothetical protein